MIGFGVLVLLGGLFAEDGHATRLEIDLQVIWLEAGHFGLEGFLQVEILLSNIVLCAILVIMKLSQWAKEQGLTYRGAWRMWKAGQLPVPAEQLPTGTILVKAAKGPTNAVGLYARVSSSDQKKDLEAQLGGWSVTPRTIAGSSCKPWRRSVLD